MGASSFPLRKRTEPNPLIGLGATELRDRLARGAARAADLARALIDHIAEREGEVSAWARLDEDHVMGQGRALDALRGTGRAIGPLHGLPVAVADTIDTVKVQTARGTVLDEGRLPPADAFVVQRLKASGALILGKTRTAELGVGEPAATRNPWAPGQGAAGACAGAAAAVAAGMAAASVDSSSAGGIATSASACGVVGFKPTYGSIPRPGVLARAPSLDTVGCFARSVEDAALIADALFGYDPLDAATEPSAPPRLAETALADPPVTPMIAFVRPPGHEAAAEETMLAFRELAEALGGQCFEAALPNAFAEAAAAHRRIERAEIAKCLYGHERRGAERLSPALRAALDEGKSVLARDYISALDWPDVLNAGLSEIFERCDALMTLAAPGEGGPEEVDFGALWTLCRTPTVTLPLLQTGGGLPLGVQLVGRRGDDARLLRTARWLSGRLAEMGENA